MQRLGFAALIAAGIVVMGHAETRKVDFTQDAVDQPPKGFEFGHTAGVGKPGRWIVQADGANKVLAQADPDSTRSRFPVAVLSDVTAADFDLSVRFKPISGRVDQAAGLVWRYQNQDNYYIVRANALEDNVVLYKVEGGKRTDLPVKGEGGRTARRAKCLRVSGVLCGWSQTGDSSRCISTAPSCTRSTTRRSPSQERSVCGPRLTRSRSSMT